MGYFGALLAVKFDNKLSVISFDIHQKHIKKLQAAQDPDLEASKEELHQDILFNYSVNLEGLKSCSFSIVIVGIHKVLNIKVLKAVKNIDNMQRDIKRTLLNKLSIIFNTISILLNKY